MYVLCIYILCIVVCLFVVIVCLLVGTALVLMMQCRETLGPDHAAMNETTGTTIGTMERGMKEERGVASVPLGHPEEEGSGEERGSLNAEVEVTKRE